MTPMTIIANIGATQVTEKTTTKEEGLTTMILILHRWIWVAKGMKKTAMIITKPTAAVLRLCALPAAIAEVTEQIQEATVTRVVAVQEILQGKHAQEEVDHFEHKHRET